MSVRVVQAKEAERSAEGAHRALKGAQGELKERQAALKTNTDELNNVLRKVPRGLDRLYTRRVIFPISLICVCLSVCLSCLCLSHFVFVHFVFCPSLNK